MSFKGVKPHYWFLVVRWGAQWVKGREEAQLVLFSPLRVSWPSLLFEGQGGISSVFNPFPSMCACCRNALFCCALFHHSLCVQSPLLSLFTFLLSLNWGRWLLCSVTPLQYYASCLWLGRRSLWVLHHLLPYPSLFHMSVKGDLSKNVHLMLVGDRRCPCTIFFMKLNLTFALRLAWGRSVYCDCMSSSKLFVYGFRPTWV